MPPPSDPKYKVTLIFNSGHQTTFYVSIVPSDWEDGDSKWMEGIDVFRHYDAEAKKGKKGSGKYKLLARRASIDLIEIVDL